MAFIYFHKPSGARQELERLDKAYRDSITALTATYNRLLVERDRQAFEAFKTAQEKANRWEGESNIWKDRYKDEKKRKTGILTDVKYDSLLRVLYPQ